SWDDHLPPARTWQDGIAHRYLKTDDVFICSRRPKALPAYAFNLALDGEKLDYARSDQPMLFESCLGVRNASDRLQSVYSHAGPGGLVFVAYQDGHVKEE